MLRLPQRYYPDEVSGMHTYDLVRPSVVSFRRAHRRSRGPFIRRRTRALCTSPAIAEGRAYPPCGPDRRSDVGRANILRATPPIYPSVSFRQGHGAAAYGATDY